jgi:hypothetical protein
LRFFGRLINDNFFSLNDNYFSRCLASKVTRKCKPQAGGKRMRPGGTKGMQGRPHPPCINA